MKKTDTSESITQVKAPKRSDVLIIRALIICGALTILLFLYWFMRPAHIGHPALFWLLTFALVFKIAKMCQEWYYYWSPSVPLRPARSRQFTVDVLTTYCPGEPKNMIERTLRAMQAITYPHTSYLCDEGDDPELKSLCQELGVVHVTRKEKKDAKAGNINNALNQATGELCLVLDPDHVPVPEFLDRVVDFFEKEEIGFVQCVQAYGNQKESFIALGAAQQTYHFYGPMMMTMNTYGTAQAIGANCTFRRKALDSIGGHAAGLAEDMHTAMQLHAKGWKSVYIPEILSRGLVPATLSSYYKQQLKWSRGVFELLFRVYPRICKNFTWRQKLHYFAMPHYFLYGLVNLFDICVPLLALLLARVPWELDMIRFGVYFFPLCTLSLTIRTYAQRWLLEKHERGLHLAGGILRTATWWIFLLGFIYSVLNIKVPYIPTPKEDEHQNHLKLCIPNIAVILISLACVYYGLSIDWTPFSVAMAFYSLLVVCILGFAVIISQQKFVASLNQVLRGMPAVAYGFRMTSAFAQRCEQVAYRFLHNGLVVLVIAVSALFLGYSKLEDYPDSADVSQKELGGFYLGIEAGGNELGIHEPFKKALDKDLNLISLGLTWGDSSRLSYAQLNAMRQKGCLPFIKWKIDGLLTDSIKYEIVKGSNQAYLNYCARIFRKYNGPIFISFPCTGGVPQAFIDSWQYLYTFFNNLGVSNLTWVWAPGSASFEDYYPGEKFVDWIGVGVLNYGTSRMSADWYSFGQIYKPFHARLGKFEKPVLITELGCHAGAEQESWIGEALAVIKKEYREIRGIVLYCGKPLFYLETGDHYQADFTPAAACLRACRTGLNDAYFTCSFFKDIPRRSHPAYRSKFVKGKPGHYELLVNNKPYYIRGIAYNTAHDWRDGFMPLTRRQLEQDFDKIREMGANTIRRYDQSIYDRNILMLASEKGLHVQYGFWFDPQKDYYADTAQVLEYIREVEERVISLKDDPAIIAWALGNETWGLLKHRFAKPYLTLVRKSYVRMLEQLAEKIHRTDPKRPVFTCIEHEEYQIAGELVAFHDDAPCIDAIGVNSYYKEQISQLNHVAWQFDSLRPYLVSEFGPRGYWDPHYNKTAEGALLEESDTEKAAWYTDQWNYYVKPNKGYNIGGFAYCWHDRMEGSCTWFGLTDFKGRPKPAYFALKALWTGDAVAPCTQIAIRAHTQAAPGATCLYTAEIKEGESADLRYEWFLHKNEFLQRAGNIEYVDEGRSALVEMPRDTSSYRLYLYVTDKAGRVSTASLPIRFTQHNLP